VRNMALRTPAGRVRRARRIAASVAALAVSASLTALAVPHADAEHAVARADAVPNPADAANPDNPLAGHNWGVYMGWGESPWAAYNGKLQGTPPPTDAQKEQLVKIVNTPKMRWFSDLMSPSTIRTKVKNTIESVTEVDPDAVVQIATFGMVGTWEYGKCPDQGAYKTWANAFADTIRSGHARTAIVVQIDGPLAANCKANRTMVRYTVGLLHTIPNTSIYIEMGSADWPAVVDPAGSLPKTQVAQSAAILVKDGIGMARGFALDTSHFDATGLEIAYGKKLVDELARRGYAGKHFVVDTSDNGAPFTGKWFHDHFGARTALDQAKPCGTRTATHCVKLGIPPTTDVTNPAWGLSDAQDAIAAQYVDAYLWIERPWQLPKNVAKGVSSEPGFKMSSAVNEAKFSSWNPLTQGGTYVLGTKK
jgi:endoglucanase